MLGMRRHAFREVRRSGHIICEVQTPAKRQVKWIRAEGYEEELAESGRLRKFGFEAGIQREDAKLSSRTSSPSLLAQSMVGHFLSQQEDLPLLLRVCRCHVGPSLYLNWNSSYKDTNPQKRISRPHLPSLLPFFKSPLNPTV